MNRQRKFEAKTMSMSRRGLFERLYEVHAGDDLCATLSFDSAFGGGATGLFGGDSWTFRRTGFFATRIIVRRATSEFDDAVFEQRRWSRGGMVTFAGGRKYSVSPDRWAAGLQVVAESGETVLAFRQVGNFSGSVEIKVAQHSPDLALLILLGCYLVAAMMEESIASAAATVAAMG